MYVRTRVVDRWIESFLFKRSNKPSPGLCTDGHVEVKIHTALQIQHSKTTEVRALDLAELGP